MAIGSVVALLASSSVIMAPIGGASVHLPPGQVVCAMAAPPGQGWIVAPDGQSIKPPVADVAIGQSVRLPVADALDHCLTSRHSVTLTAIGPIPIPDWSSTIWDVDAGQITVHGRQLKGVVLQWAFGSKAGQDRCSTPAQDGQQEQCFFAIDRSLSAIPEQLQLKLLPAGYVSTAGSTLYDATGRPASPPDSGYVAEASLSKLLPTDATADVGAGVGRLLTAHPEAIGSVDCEDAICELDGNAVVIHDEHGDDDVLKIRLGLRPHLSLRNGSPPRMPVVVVPLQRCPLSFASQTIFRGLSDERVALRLGGRCADDSTLQLWGASGPVPVIADTHAGGLRYVLVEVGRVDGEELVLTLRRDQAIVGRASHATEPPPQASVRIELPGIGPVGFIPTNRSAKVLLPPPVPGLTWRVKPVPGFYDVTTDASGVSVRGISGAAGAVSLHLAMRDDALPGLLHNADLIEVTDPAFRSIQVAHVPVALYAPDTSKSLVDLECGDGSGHVASLKQGTTSYVPFPAHDTCRVVLHSERLPAENGSQTVRYVVDVTSSDGSNKADAHVDRHVVLRPGGQPETLYLKGIDTPFDRVRARVEVEPAESVEEGLAPTTAVSEAQWTVVFGTSHARLYATMAFPTGLFRVSDQADSGILTLNAGALLRAVLLSKDGQENPFGLEAGVLWVNISGDSTSPHGDVAIVLGAGVGVPIANSSRLTQTSINLHAWLEYEVSRALVRGETGSPWGFVFGPSLTIGDAGRNF